MLRVRFVNLRRQYHHCRYTKRKPRHGTISIANTSLTDTEKSYCRIAV